MRARCIEASAASVTAQSHGQGACVAARADVVGLAALAREHGVLGREFGRVQERCSRIMGDQAAEIERLNALLMRQRAATIRKDTQLAWLTQDMQRLALRLVELERQNASLRHQLGAARHRPSPHEAEDAPESALAAAELVICQTGCIGHHAYWRAQDACRRTGRECVLVEAERPPAEDAGESHGD